MDSLTTFIFKRNSVGTTGPSRKVTATPSITVSILCHPAGGSILNLPLPAFILGSLPAFCSNSWGVYCFLLLLQDAESNSTAMVASLKYFIFILLMTLKVQIIIEGIRSDLFASQCSNTLHD